MIRHKKMLLTGLYCFLFIAGFSCSHALAQQKKGDVEVLFASGGFTFNSGGEINPVSLAGFSGAIGSDSRSQEFYVSGQAGYFLTRKNELGGGLSLTLFHDHFCETDVSVGQITGSSCSSSTTPYLGLSGFYRYNFAKEGAKGFPFAGFDISVADIIHRDFTGDIVAIPRAGYKYFVRRNVALDGSVGYQIALNKAVPQGFTQTRPQSIIGEVGLSFLF
jgi:hypothetical protein